MFLEGGAPIVKGVLVGSVAEQGGLLVCFGRLHGGSWMGVGACSCCPCCSSRGIICVGGGGGVFVSNRCGRRFSLLQLWLEFAALSDPSTWNQKGLASLHKNLGLEINAVLIFDSSLEKPSSIKSPLLL